MEGVTGESSGGRKPLVIVPKSIDDARGRSRYGDVWPDTRVLGTKFSGDEAKAGLSDWPL